nr:hypothetical protein CFP56_35036 [Quercus suber]
MGHQPQRLGCGDSGSGEPPVDSGQRKEDDPTVDVTGRWRGSRGGAIVCIEDVFSPAQGMKGVRNPTKIQLLKGELAHHQRFTSVQTIFRIQQQHHSEGTEYGNVGA